MGPAVFALGLSAVPFTAPVPPVSMPVAAQVRQFIGVFHGDLIQRRPDLFRKKMEKAIGSDRTFYRAFPQLYYQVLAQRTEAKVLAETKKLLLAGDLHPENTELVEHLQARVPQPNDFDDAAVAPVGVEIARVLGGAGLLGRDAKERRALIAEARSGYLAALRKKDFKSWEKGIQDEKALRKASWEDREWRKNAGVPITDKRLRERLLKAAGLGGPAVRSEWEVFDRRGAGLSSIGVERYMFVHKKGYAWELKQLRAPALAYFGEAGGPAEHRDRVGLAYKKLREVPAKARTFRWKGQDWSLRFREQFQLPVAIEKEASAARVLGGMAARMHLRLADPADLEAALKAATPRMVEGSLRTMDKMRAALRRLLKEGAWPTP